MNVPGVFEKYASHFSRIFLWKVFDECENGVSMNRKFEKYIYQQLRESTLKLNDTFWSMKTSYASASKH